MKNIYIIGVPRSGKTTLTKLIKNQFNYYNEFSFQSIISSLKIINVTDEKRLAKFITHFVNANSVLSGYPCLIEGTFTDIKTLDELKNPDDIIICLGLGCRNLEQVVEGLEDHDIASDYTYQLTKDEKSKKFADIPNKDLFNYIYCKEHTKNIYYFDTYNHREKVFNNIIDKLK